MHPLPLPASGLILLSCWECGPESGHYHSLYSVVYPRVLSYLAPFAPLPSKACERMLPVATPLFSLVLVILSQRQGAWVIIKEKVPNYHALYSSGYPFRSSLFLECGDT